MFFFIVLVIVIFAVVIAISKTTYDEETKDSIPTRIPYTAEELGLDEPPLNTNVDADDNRDPITELNEKEKAQGLNAEFIRELNRINNYNINKERALLSEYFKAHKVRFSSILNSAKDISNDIVAQLNIAGINANNIVKAESAMFLIQLKLGTMSIYACGFSLETLYPAFYRYYESQYKSMKFSKSYSSSKFYDSSETYYDVFIKSRNNGINANIVEKAKKIFVDKIIDTMAFDSNLTEEKIENTLDSVFVLQMDSFLKI